MHSRVRPLVASSLRRGVISSAALAVAGLSLAVSTATPASAATCSITDYGRSGFTGDITGSLGLDQGWAESAGPTGGLDWGNMNDHAIGQKLTHPVTDLCATAPIIEFDALWRQAAEGLETESVRINVFYGGVLYAQIETPGPDNQYQRAITRVFAGASLSPAFPDRATGLSGTTLTSFTLTLPSGVPSNGELTFSMSNTHDNGTAANGSADDVWLGGISANLTDPEVGVPIIDPVVGGVTGLALVGAGALMFQLRRSRVTS